jgi:SnoaL-like protein
MPGDMSAESDRIDPGVIADLIANTQLVLHERAGRDRGWWRQMRDCWDPDGEVHVAWFQGIAADFIDQSEKMAGRRDLTRHRLTPPVVYLNEDRAVVEVGAAIDSRFTVHSVEADLIVYTRLLYRTQRRRGSWRIARMDCIYERDTLTPALPMCPIPLDAAALANLRPSYRMGAYVFGERGYTINQQLSGDDRPEQVAALYRDAFHWAGLGRETDRVEGS